MEVYLIACDKCGKVLEIEANSLLEAEQKSELIDCCKK